MMESGLPPNWVVRWSKSRNIPYYFNTARNESQWEPPADADQVKLKAYMASKHSAPPLQQQPNQEGKIRCAHLLVKHNQSRRPSSWKEPEITRTKEEAMEIILNFEARIRAGEASLADLATSESDCSSARKRGDLGFFGRGEMQKEFEDAAFALKVGEMSHPVETASGIHLIERLA
ncbi:peptidyl-prolyl cis-trans isomeras-like protein 1 [Kalaharituber pfeilii]|nr:peptidyl-prolyl cis-trans isomeras-like protein 1 [Kalaharituber pfeilii]